LQPVRSSGGFRLYTDDDAARVARMRGALEAGLSAAEAAHVALSDQPQADEPLLGDAPDRLLEAIETYDEAGAQTVLDQSLAAFGVEAVLRDLILPALVEVGAAWERGALDVSQEHFATHLVRGRLLALARFWGRGSGPVALLACAPGERHDISLLAFGLVLRSYGWRILFLGADTPLETVRQAVERADPALAVITSFSPALFGAEAPGLRRLGRRVPLALAGPGATDELCRMVGAVRLDGDLVAAAGEVAARVSEASAAPAGGGAAGRPRGGARRDPA
jgi:MerR family transcriptional regulator, light-induced transcriptional regulator